MPCCTYLNSKELTQDVSNKDLNALLKQVREKTKEDIRLEERKFTKGRLWWKKDVFYYSLYWHVDGAEFQVLNFYNQTGSLGLLTNASVIANYLMGILNGIDFKERLTM